MRISFNIAKKNIAKLWFLLSSIIIIIVIIQTINNNFENHNKLVWGWVSTNIFPTLSLIISIFVIDLNKEENKLNKEENNEFEVDKFFYTLVYYISLFYLITIFVIIISEPVTKISIVNVMRESSLYLGPLQGLVSAAVGIFFIKAK